MSEFFRSTRVADGCEICAWFFHPQYGALGLGSFWAQGQGQDPGIRVQGLGFRVAGWLSRELVTDGSCLEGSVQSLHHKPKTLRHLRPKFLTP